MNGLVPASAAWTWKDCGSQHKMGAGWYNVRSHDVGCPDARRVAKKYWNTGDRTITVDGMTFRCKKDRAGTELYNIRCRTSDYRVVKFQTGS